MALPVTIPNTFANATSSIPLANLDANFVTIYGAVNGIGNGAEALANVSISGGNATFTTANATTVDATNVEVTNIKAKDGTAAGSIADATGVVTLASSVLTTADINGGTIDATTVGATTASTGSFTTLTTSSTVTHNGGTANGVAFLNASKVLTTGSALTFDGTNVDLGTVSAKLNFATTGSASRNFVGVAADGFSLEMVTQRGAIQPIRYLQDFGAGHIWSITGSEQMRLTSTGLGIGTSSPQEKLMVSGTSNPTVIRIDNAANTFAINTGPRITLFSSYRSGFPTEVTQSGYIATQKSNGVDSDFGFDLAFAARENGNSVAEKMRITGAGNVGIGTSSPVGRVEAVAAAEINNDNVNTNVLTLTSIDNDGGFYYANQGAGVAFRSGLVAGATFGPEVMGAIYGANSAQESVANGQLTFHTRTSGSVTEKMRLDSSGNLGLGVAPSAFSSAYRAFQFGQRGAVYAHTSVSATNLADNTFDDGTSVKYIVDGTAQRYEMSAGSHAFFTAPSGTAGNAISFTQAMTLTSAGNLLVGVTSGNFHRFFKSSASDFAVQVANTSATTPFGHNITFSAAAPNNATSMFLRCDDTDLTGRIQLRSNGGIANFSGNNVNLSDRREKTNFAPAKSYLDTICAIPVQTFNYIDQNHEDDPGLTLGVVAQDVQEVAPELVMESNWGTEEEPKMRLSIYQTDLQYALMKCIQEQQALITALTARIAALESN